MWASHQDLYQNIIIFKNNLINKLEIDHEEVTENDIVINLLLKLFNKSMMPLIF